MNYYCDVSALMQLQRRGGGPLYRCRSIPQQSRKISPCSAAWFAHPAREGASASRQVVPCRGPQRQRKRCKNAASSSESDGGQAEPPSTRQERGLSLESHRGGAPRKKLDPCGSPLLCTPGGELKPGDVLQGGKYTIVEMLGSGSNARTYGVSAGGFPPLLLSSGAYDTAASFDQASMADGKRVAIKALSLASIKDWKQLDLFQREAQVRALMVNQQLLPQPSL